MSQFFINSSSSGPPPSQDLHVAKWIVNQTPNAGGNQPSIASAISAAVPGETIFLFPGIYPENFTIPPGINLAAFDCDAITPNVTILGKITMTGAGTSTISGIRVKTNGDFAIAVTGSADSILEFKNCYLDFTNNIGISYTSSSSSSRLNFFNCQGGNLNSGKAYFAMTSNGVLDFNYCILGGSDTASTCSAGTVVMRHTECTFSTTTSGTGGVSFSFSNIVSAIFNLTCVTCSGSGRHLFEICTLQSGTDSALTVTSTADIDLCTLDCTNLNALAGAGTVELSSCSFANSGVGIVPTLSGRRTELGSLNLSGTSGTTGTIVTNNVSVYEEGNFTPTIQGLSSAGTTTYSFQSGLYQRIGNMVTISINISISAATGTGSLTVGNFPFTVNSSSNYLATGSVSFNGSGWAWPAGTTSLAAQTISGGTSCTIRASGSSTAASDIQMSNSALILRAVISYMI